MVNLEMSTGDPNTSDYHTEDNSSVTTGDSTSAEHSAACIVPTNIWFRKLMLLSSEMSSFTKSKEDVGYMIYEVSMSPPPDIQVIDLTISTSSGRNTRITKNNSDCLLTEFFMDRVAFCARGSNEFTNRSVMIAVRPDDCPNGDGQHPSAPLGAVSLWLTLKSRKEQYMTHIIRCPTTFEASRLLAFASQHLEDRPNKPPPPASSTYRQVTIRLLLDIKELDKTNGTLLSTPKEKLEWFKLRSGTEKRLLVGFNQSGGLPRVVFKDCLGVYLAYGRYISDGELISLGEAELKHISTDQLISTTSVLPGASCFAQFPWPSNAPDTDMFDEVTGKDSSIFFTVAVHLKLANVQQPIWIRRVCQARVYPPDETFWLMVDRRPVVQDYSFILKEIVDDNGNLFIGNFSEAYTAISSVEAESEKVDHTTVIHHVPVDEADDENEPFMSGNGDVSREITDDQALTEWGQLIKDWHTHVKRNMVSSASFTTDAGEKLETDIGNHSEKLWGGTIGPSLAKLGSSSTPLVQTVRRLVGRGIPDALRAEVWHLLAACPLDETALMDAFRILITKPCQYDAVIRRDLTRTFPASTFFRDEANQSSLFQVSRAYSLYDDEVGYCQGLSFFVAALLLHMPVEQAFTLLVQVNNHYGVRELFLDDFKGLHMRLYQLERLVQDKLPEVAKHFSDLGLQAHMYASQWFLTLFTARFPLPVVFCIVDLFLAEGMIFIFKAAMSVLRMSRRELLGLDFEGTLRFLRVTLPKRCLAPEVSKELLSTALSFKITSAKLIKYAKDWNAIRSRQEESENPVVALEQQVTTLRTEVARLERENESLATELVSSKAAMHLQVEELEDKADVLTRELFSARQDMHDVLEEKLHLEREVAQVKQMLRMTLAEASAIDNATNDKTSRDENNRLETEDKTSTCNNSNDQPRVEFKPVCPNCKAALQLHPDAENATYVEDPQPANNSCANGNTNGPVGDS